MRNLLLTLLILLTFSACENPKEEQARKEAEIAKKVRAEMLAQFEAQQEAQKIAFEKKLSEAKESNKTKTLPTPPKDESKLTQMGIDITKDSISIDTNKTKKYINKVSHDIDKKIKEIGDDLEKGIIKTKEAGIDINEKHIHIDLNKTQNLIENWGKKVQGFVNQFDEMAKTLDTNNTK